MKLTLFIDESGFQQDHERQNGVTTPDVVGGLLWFGDEEEASATLARRFTNLIGSHPLPDCQKISQGDLHLTDLRATAPMPWLEKFVPELLEAACPGQKGGYIAVTRRDGARGDSVQRERDYRVMFAELIALVGVVLPSDEAVQQMTVVYASRATDDAPLTLAPQVLEALEGSFEWDLLTRSFVQLSRSHIHFTRLQANDHWGMIAADFLCNTIFNALRDRPEARDLVETLVSRQRLRLFEAFGDRPLRRARLAERDGRWSEALERWLLHDTVDPVSREERTKSIGRAVKGLLQMTAATALNHAVNSVRERIHRHQGSADWVGKRLSVISELADTLEQVGRNDPRMPAILFGLRNYLLLNANHLLRVTQARLLISRQNQMLPVLIQDPQHLNEALNALLYETETDINDLNFPAALSKAKQFQQAVTSYESLAECMSEAFSAVEMPTGLSTSQIKARTTMLRSQLLNVASPQDMNLGDLEREILALSTELHPQTEPARRLATYSIWLRLKQNDTGRAVTEARSLLEIESAYPWAWFWAARATIDHAITTKERDLSESRRFLAHLKRYLNDGEWGDGLVGALLLREAAILAGVVLSHRVEAESFAKNAIQSMQLLAGDSPLGVWLLAMSHMTEAHRWNRQEEWASLFPERNVIPFWNNFTDRAAFASSNQGTMPFLELRYVSPY